MNNLKLKNNHLIFKNKKFKKYIFFLYYITYILHYLYDFVIHILVHIIVAICQHMLLLLNFLLH